MQHSAPCVVNTSSWNRFLRCFFVAVKLFNDFSDDAVVGQILYFTGIVRLGSVVCGQPMASSLQERPYAAA